MARCSKREGAGRSELWCDEMAFYRKDTSEEGSEGQFSKEEGAQRVCWEGAQRVCWEGAQRVCWEECA
eukprot:3625837-Pleurochrysis_carterae.AAC.1